MRIDFDQLSSYEEFSKDDYVEGRIISINSSSTSSTGKETQLLELRIESINSPRLAEDDSDSESDSERRSRDEQEEEHIDRTGLIILNIHLMGHSSRVLSTSSEEGQAFKIGTIIRFWLDNCTLSTLEKAKPNSRGLLKYSNGVRYRQRGHDEIKIKDDSESVSTERRTMTKKPLQHSKDVNVHHPLPISTPNAKVTLAAPSSTKATAPPSLTTTTTTTKPTNKRSLTPSSNSKDSSTTKNHKANKAFKKSKDSTTNAIFDAPCPSGYLDLGTIDEEFKQRNSKGHHIIAAVKIVSEPRKSSGTDFTIGLELFGPGCREGGLRMNVFRSRVEDLPQINEDEDVIIVQNVNWTSNPKYIFTPYANKARFVVLSKIQLLNTSTTIDPAKIKGFLPKKLDEAAILYARRACKFLHDCQLAPGSLKSGSKHPSSEWNAKEKSSEIRNKNADGSSLKSSKRLHATISKMREEMFYDTIVEVVNAYCENESQINRLGTNDCVDLHVVDYTTNSELYDYDKAPYDRSPPGQYVLQISVYGNQAQPLAHILEPLKSKRSVILSFRNLRVKRNRSGFLEATIWQDDGPRYAGARDITIPSNLDFKLHEFKARRERFFSELVRAEKEKGQMAPVFASNTSLRSSTGTVVAESKPQVGTKGLEVQPFEDVEMASTVEVAPAFRAQEKNESTAELDSKAILTISDVVASGQIGHEYRIRAKVISLFPLLAQWVVAYCCECHNRLDSGDSKCPKHLQAEIKLRYFFHFELVDATKSGPTISVTFDSDLCSDPFNPSFLPNLPPTDEMRRDHSDEFELLGERFNDVLGGVVNLYMMRNLEVGEESWGPVREWTVKKIASHRYLVGREMKF